MSITIEIPSEYGYVILAATSTFVLNIIHAFKTGTARKAAKIPYPNCYASVEVAKTNKDAYIFNCAQRAHANFQENHTTALVSMLIAGLVYPRAAAALGLGWTLNRYLYLIGYTNPALGEGGKGRYYGIGYMLCQNVLLGMVGYVGYGMVTST